MSISDNNSPIAMVDGQKYHALGNAAFIVKACNAHASLTATAELLEELLPSVQLLVNSSPLWPQGGKQKCIDLLAKAKELK